MTTAMRRPPDPAANNALVRTRRYQRRGRRKDGVLDMRARTSAKNGRPRKVFLVGHAATSRALRYGVLDLRSPVGREYRAICETLAAHLGNELSAPEKALIDQAARLRLLTRFAWLELERTGAFRKAGQSVPAFDAYRRAAADEREVLRLLGIQRRTKDVPSLQDYLKGKGGADGQAHE